MEPVGFNRGFYTVDVRYFYRVTADAFVGAARPVEVSGLCVFDKRVILFGSEGTAKIFSSQTSLDGLDEQHIRQSNLPTAVVEITVSYPSGLNTLDVVWDLEHPFFNTKGLSYWTGPDAKLLGRQTGFDYALVVPE